MERNGTSFAAPLVSLIASQLAWEGLSPAQIKERLIISSHVDERVVHKSYSGGVLDAVRALSLWQDVVTFDRDLGNGAKSTSTVSGRLESKFSKVQICGQEVEHGRLRSLTLSVVPGDAGRRGNWRGWATTQGQLQRLDACPDAVNAVSGSMMKIRLDDGKLEQIDVASIRSFTARFR